MKNRYTKQPRYFSFVSLLVACGITAATAHAQAPRDTRELELSAGYGRSDNVYRVSQDGGDSDFSVVGLRIDVDINRPRYEFSAAGDVNYYYYSDDQIEDRPEGDLDLQLTAQVIPDVLDWYATNTFTQIRQEITSGNQPDNLNEINVLSSGLVLDIPLGNRTSFSADVGASDRTVDSPFDLDSTDLSAGVGIFRQVRSRSRIGLTAGIQNVTYDDAVDTEYDIERIAIRYESQLASGDVDIELGANRLNDKAQSEKGDVRPLVSINWVRDIGRRSQLGISGRHRISELGGAITGGVPGQVVVPRAGQFVATQVPFTDTNVSAFLASDWSRASFSGSVLFSKQLFDSDTLEDANTVGINLLFVRNLSNTVSLELSTSLSRREAIRSETVSDDLFAGLRLSKQIGRRFSISAAYQFNDRDSDVGETYTENVYRVDFAWLVLR